MSARMDHYNSCKARGVCVNCVSRKAVRGRVRCRLCLRKSVRSTQRWDARHADYKREQQLHRMQSLYWSNPDVFREIAAARRLAKKVNGICQDCPLPCLEDNIRCRRCRDKDRASTRRWDERRRRREREDAARYQPLDEIIDLTRVRVLRFARRLDWFTARDLTEALGIVEPTQRNTITQMLNRLVRAGRFDRMRTFGVLKARAAGAQYEYRITRAGCEEIDGVLRTGQATRRGRRAA